MVHTHIGLDILVQFLNIFPMYLSYPESMPDTSTWAANHWLHDARWMHKSDLFFSNILVSCYDGHKHSGE